MYILMCICQSILMHLKSNMHILHFPLNCFYHRYIFSFALFISFHNKTWVSSYAGNHNPKVFNGRRRFHGSDLIFSSFLIFAVLQILLKLESKYVFYVLSLYGKWHIIIFVLFKCKKYNFLAKGMCIVSLL